MPQYVIDPAGVQKVLTATGSQAAEFETLLTPMSGHVESAVSGCGSSGAVVPALNAFFEAQGVRLTGIGARVTACLTGAGAATTAYVQGDYEMVATYQTNASQAKISEIPR